VPSDSAPTRSVLQVFQPVDGGVPEHVRRLSLGLTELGWRVGVAGPPNASVRAPLETGGVEYYSVDIARELSTSDVRAARRLKAIDEKGRFGVVHAHSSKAGYLIRVCLQGPDRLIYTPHCFAFLAEFSPFERVASLVMEAALARRSGAIVAASRWEALRATKALRLPADKLHIIRYGVDLQEDSAPASELAEFADGRPLIGMVSVLRVQKDPLTLVRAAPVLRDHLRANARIAVVGNGPLETAVTGEIERLGLQDMVRWFPFRPPVGPYLRALDCFVLPSRWESLPIAVLEAMAAGTPVVATRVSGTPEAVQDGVTGRLVPAERPEALAGAIASLVRDPRARREMGNAARELAAEEFSAERMVAQISNLYEARSKIRESPESLAKGARRDQRAGANLASSDAYLPR
jgi:glycosyltransferase involved in cell wall biosynthesis